MFWLSLAWNQVNNFNFRFLKMCPMFVGPVHDFGRSGARISNGHFQIVVEWKEWKEIWFLHDPFLHDQKIKTAAIWQFFWYAHYFFSFFWKTRQIEAWDNSYRNIGFLNGPSFRYGNFFIPRVEKTSCIKTLLKKMSKGSS